VAQASVLRTEGYRLLNRGMDPTPRLKEAVAAADRGLHLDPNHVVLMNIRSAALQGWIDSSRMRGTYERGVVAPYLQEAEALARAHPGEPYYMGHLGGIAQAMARAELTLGQDPSAEAVTALHAYGAGLKAQPRHVGYHRGVLIARSVQARAMLRSGVDPTSIVDLARADFQKAKEAQVPLETVASGFLECLTSKASYDFAQGIDFAGPLGEAGKLERLLDVDSDNPVEVGTIRLNYFALALRQKPQPRFQAMRSKGQLLAQALVRRKLADPDCWLSLANFWEACGQHEEADRARAHAHALNPRKHAV
jgi:hypothetical protein